MLETRQSKQKFRSCLSFRNINTGELVRVDPSRSALTHSVHSDGHNLWMLIRKSAGITYLKSHIRELFESTFSNNMSVKGK